MLLTKNRTHSLVQCLGRIFRLHNLKEKNIKIINADLS
jgi:hypothetical protein